MRTMMKLFVMMLVVAVVAPSALAAFNAGDVRIWVYDSRDTGAGRTAIYRSNAWPVGGGTTMQTNTLIDKAPGILDPGGMTIFGQHVYMTTKTGNNQIRRYDLDGKIAPLGLSVLVNGDLSNEAGGFAGIAVNGQAGSVGIYVSDQCPSCPNDPAGEIRRYNLDGSFNSMFHEIANPRTGGPFGSNPVDKNAGSMTWHNGRLYVESTNSNGSWGRISVFESDGTFLGNLPGAGLQSPNTGGRLAIRGDGTLFAMDRGAIRTVRSWKLGTASDLSDYVDQGAFGEANGGDTLVMQGMSDIDIDPRTGALIVLARDGGDNTFQQFGSLTGDFIQEIARWTGDGANRMVIIPEPATLGLIAVGGMMILHRRRRA